jgi:hypothetical protein
MQRGSSWLLPKFHVAGFCYHAGKALSEMMRPGDALALVAEPEDNGHVARKRRWCIDYRKTVLRI